MTSVYHCIPYVLPIYCMGLFIIAAAITCLKWYGRVTCEDLRSRSLHQLEAL